MLREIGSEFWQPETGIHNDHTIEQHYKYLLTGRTAIDYIIKDIKQYREFKLIYLPSYCCHSMIQPFLDNGIAVEFYPVYFENGKFTYDINYETKCDAILIMQYFGFYNNEVEDIIAKFQNLGKLVIEDATHSWLSEIPYHIGSNYVIASFRKWTGISCGAIALKKEREFEVSLSNVTNHKYIQLRKQAAELKKQFIEKGQGDKETFINMFNLAEHILEHDYQNYSIPQQNEEIINRIDFHTIKMKRKMNSKYLINGLQEYTNIDILKTSNKDTPLFVPIILKCGKRDKLRNYLIDHDIYCPVHWPISSHHSLNNRYLYENSLSLICDQRYELSDMNRIVETINRFYGG
jgi:hypothetical protein